MPVAPRTGALDINEVFRGGGRSVEFLDEINKASIVMLDETGIVPHPVAAAIARGIMAVIELDRGTQPRRSADYLDYEPRLAAVAGADASRLHTGRSRQDIASAIARMNLRDGLLQELEALSAAREKLLAVAGRHTETIIPAYTHGVQAQPTTFAHYLHAFAAALGREVERLQQAYARVNRNPLGAAALATSSFPLDRPRLAALLGFEGLVENAYDANHLAPVDSALEVAGALAIAAVQMGQLAQDIHAQYAGPEPWFLLAEGELTGVSSIMPQKRNPAALEQLRAQASIMLGEMHTVFLVAHNNRTGMFDYRMYHPVPHERPLQVFRLFRQVVNGIVVNRERALAEVRADYSTTTEIADALAQRANVPFRAGHHFASKLTDYGRGNGLKLQAIPYAEAARLYQEQTKQPFPLSEAGFAEVISAEYMVHGRKGLGGPQPAEVKRMLSAECDKVAAEFAWLEARAGHLASAGAALERAFAALAS
ncbi:MAG TPA: argininosuccinate lyase [Gemmatimonadales bacterium]|nr:argininosuccinate lyase [Gemmatimonadales bacterium]